MVQDSSVDAGSVYSEGIIYHRLESGNTYTTWRLTVNTMCEFLLTYLQSCSPVANKLVHIQVTTLYQLICLSNAHPLLTSLTKLSTI
jgi:hypothetical protein